MKSSISNHKLIAGVDEAGRGPLAGPVIAAAVILNPRKPIDGLTDSKLLSHKKRVHLGEKIKENALAWSLAAADIDEIDSLNIHHATLLAMKRAVEGLSRPPSKVQVDGKFCPSLACEAQAIVNGDYLIPAISAASILAKVFRDETMLRLHEIEPRYGFDQNKGYPTPFHLKQLKEYGISFYHRRSYAPVRACLKDKIHP